MGSQHAKDVETVLGSTVLKSKITNDIFSKALESVRAKKSAELQAKAEAKIEELVKLENDFVKIEREFNKARDDFNKKISRCLKEVEAMSAGHDAPAGQPSNDNEKQAPEGSETPAPAQAQQQ